ncbi:TetR/AcrR family transcriptional regulator [Actinomadura sp. CNU-125]|uniref:TetR/AcrR family transcriptional regulator n=1 Tax=Actinomadura sp. CNU-125 TaxID=1904961 RepID=UPI0009FA3FBD|nr:TetR family transcriptional regulator [Actinomadura sp. CNU-125]
MLRSGHDRQPRARPAGPTRGGAAEAAGRGRSGVHRTRLRRARIEDIAHAAGFTKGAVYSNFGGKQELFGAVLGQGAQDELAAVTAEIDGTTTRAR